MNEKNNGKLLSVSFGRKRIEFRCHRSNRKTLGITVRPDASVIVAVPRKASVDAVLKKVRKRAAWILKQQDYFRDFMPRIPPHRYVSGETHWFLGRQYRLKIVEGNEESVKLKAGRLLVQIPSKTNLERIKRLLQRWYSAHARNAIDRSLLRYKHLLGKHLTRQPIIRLHSMRARWGSFTRSGAILLNPELVKTPRSCIDYVVAHELCHLVYPYHNRGFFQLLQQAIPDWETRKARLERTSNA